MRVPALTALALALNGGAAVGPANAQQVPCVTVFDIDISAKRAYCNTPEGFAREIEICETRLEALTDRERNGDAGRHLWAHCMTLKNAAAVMGYNARSREQEQQRIEDARRRLRALGVEQ